MNKQQQNLDNLFKDQGWKYWSPLVILARLQEESGELARLINHIYGSKKKKIDEKEQELEEELGDILFTLACFANSHNIDLDKALERSIKKAKDRDGDRF